MRSRESAHARIAALSIETGISPSDLLRESPEMINALIDYLNFRSDEIRRRSKR